MGDIYLLDMPINRQHIADRKMAKLQQQISALENRIQENGALRRQLEGINDAEKERSQRVIDKVKNRNMVLTDEIDRIYKHRNPLLGPSPSQLVGDVISRRTQEFSELQQEKALQIKYLMAEKQRLQVAQEKLREKRRAMNRMPTPEGKMTQRYWGQKYDIYTPLSYDTYFDIYTPVYEHGYYTYFPDDYWYLKRKYSEDEYLRRAARKRRNRKFLYVPRPLYESNSW